MSGKWDEVDPRVQWAIDILDSPPGWEPSSVYTHYFPAGLCTIIGGAIIPIRNVVKRMPFRTSLPATLLLAAAGFQIGNYLNDMKAERRQEKMAVAKHYIMTHPELFPEPERKKFGDRVYLSEWEPAR